MKRHSLVPLLAVMLVFVGSAFAKERAVVLSVQADFRGPIILRDDPSYEGLPEVRGHEVIFNIPASGVAAFKTIEPANRVSWDRCLVRYPNGKVISAFNQQGPPDGPEKTYLFLMGMHAGRGKPREQLMLVASYDEVLAFQSLHTRGADPFKIWKELQTKRNAPNQSTQPTRGETPRG